MLHYFNPGNETAVLNDSPYYTLPARPARMQHDLAFLPAWYAAPDDFILTGSALDKSFPDQIKDLPELPRAITRKDIEHTPGLVCGNQVSLWGISPQSIHLFEQYNDRYHLNLEIPPWNGHFRELCSRRTAHACLQYLLSEIPEISLREPPEFYESIGSIEKILEQNGFRMLIKAPYSSSGRGLLWVQHPMDRSSRLILQGMLNKQQEVSLEKALDKQTDLAMLFDSNPDGSVRFKGYSVFQTDTKGNYKGNLVASQKQLENLLYSSVDGALFKKVEQALIRFFTKYIATIYQGCICVDMLIYRDGNGRLCLHPCIEINFRHSMGWLALHLHQNYIAKDVSGDFRIEFYKNPEDLYKNHLEMQSEYPLIIDDKRVVSGYLPLCPVTGENQFTAFAVINR